MSSRSDHLAVRRLGRAEAAGVTSVLAEAFADYPVMRFVLGDAADYAPRLQRLVGLFVMARVLRDEPVLGIGEPDGLKAAALVSFPGRGTASPELGRLRAEVFAELGEDAQARYEAFGRATEPFQVDEPHIHLNMIGVRRAHQGSGLGRRLMERVHRLSLEDPLSSGVTLSTEEPRNVPLYELLGYRSLGRARVAPGLETWGFHRPDPPVPVPPGGAA